MLRCRNPVKRNLKAIINVFFLVWILNISNRDIRALDCKTGCLHTASFSSSSCIDQKYNSTRKQYNFRTDHPSMCFSQHQQSEDRIWADWLFRNQHPSTTMLHGTCWTNMLAFGLWEQIGVPECAQARMQTPSNLAAAKRQCYSCNVTINKLQLLARIWAFVVDVQSLGSLTS